MTRLSGALFGLALGLMAGGCFDTNELGPDGSPGGPDAGALDAGAPAPPPPAANELDLLLAMDNSGSLTEEHASFTRELPFFFEAIASGDHDGDGVAEARPFTSIHVGVVTGDMGTGGAVVPTCADSDFGDDGVLWTEGRTDIPGCAATYPTFLRFDTGAAAVGDFARDVACVANLGTGGCGFEQPLEGMLKALSPASPTAWTREDFVAPTFFRGTSGHGSGANAGFLRADSLLAVVMLTDESDCSARDAEIFDPNSRRYTADLNLRCFSHAEALHPIERYVDGLLQLRSHPDRLVFFPIAGIPLELEPAPGAPPDYDALVSEDPTLRDDRMKERIDPANPTRLLPSCNEPGIGLAFAPVRIVRVAAALDARGARTSVASVCTTDQRSAMEILLSLLRP